MSYIMPLFVKISHAHTHRDANIILINPFAVKEILPKAGLCDNSDITLLFTKGFGTQPNSNSLFLQIID